MSSIASFFQQIYLELIVNGWLKTLGQAFCITLGMTVICFVCATVLACLLCAGFRLKNKALRTVIIKYDSLVQMIPPLQMMLIFMLIVFVGKGYALLSAFIGMTLYMGTAIAGIFNTCLNTIDRGEIEAARSLGMNRKQTFRHIIVPQVASRSVDLYISSFITCVQTTSVTATIGVLELTETVLLSQNPLISLIIAIAAYVLIGLLGNMILRKLCSQKHISSKEGVEA